MPHIWSSWKETQSLSPLSQTQWFSLTLISLMYPGRECQLYTAGLLWHVVAGSYWKIKVHHLWWHAWWYFHDSELQISSHFNFYVCILFRKSFPQTLHWLILSHHFLWHVQKSHHQCDTSSSISSNQLFHSFLTFLRATEHHYHLLWKSSPIQK